MRARKRDGVSARDHFLFVCFSPNPGKPMRAPEEKQRINKVHPNENERTNWFCSTVFHDPLSQSLEQKVENELFQWPNELEELKMSFSPLHPYTHKTQRLVWVPWCDSRNRASQYQIEATSWQR